MTTELESARLQTLGHMITRTSFIEQDAFNPVQTKYSTRNTIAVEGIPHADLQTFLANLRTQYE